MSAENKETKGVDPCAVGPEQRYAWVWFTVVLIFSVWLCFRLAITDRWMYDNDAETLDFGKFRENRMASTQLATEHLDERASGDYTSAVEKLKHR